VSRKGPPDGLTTGRKSSITLQLFAFGSDLPE
jgi:hypothetical protein